MKNPPKRFKQFRVKERKIIIKTLTRKYGQRCWYCGKELRESEIQVDHIIPFSKSKNNDIDNLALTCFYCNSRKWYSSVEEFLQYLAYIRTGNFWCPILQQYKDKLDSSTYDILQKSFY